MPIHDFRDMRCYIVYGDVKQPMKLSGLQNVTFETQDSVYLQYPIRIDGELSFTLQLSKESTRQIVAIANGYQNYNCMCRDIRRQKRKLKDMRKRAKKVKYGSDSTDSNN